MNYKSILIVTYGRSGSTLLQGVLNAIEGCVIRGENNNFCYHLFKAYKALKETKKANANDDNPRNPWFGYSVLDIDLYLDQIKVLVKRLLLAEKINDPSIVCYGFKEIRYMKRYHVEEFFDYLEFLKKIFPEVAFIFNVRGHGDVITSGWWRRMNTTQVRKEIIDLEAKFSTYCTKNDNAFYVRYEDLVSKGDRLKAMFEFLGAEYDAQQVERVLKVRHGYQTERE